MGMHLEEAGVVRVDLPEHGAVELPLAGIGARAAAAIIDNVVFVFAALGLLAAAGLLGGVSLEAIRLVGAPVLIVALSMPIVLPAVFELAWRGQTPGKRWLGIRVVSADGTEATWVQLLWRNVIRLVDFMPTAYGVAVISAFVSTRGQRLGDLVANTLVVREDVEGLLGAIAFRERSDTTDANTKLREAAQMLIRREIPDAARAKRVMEIATVARSVRPELADRAAEEIVELLQQEGASLHA